MGLQENLLRGIYAYGRSNHDFIFLFLLLIGYIMTGWFGEELI